MSAIADISLNDSVPLAHIFKHVNHDGKNFTWRDSTAGLTILSAPTVVLSILPSKDSGVERMRTKVIMPVLETITGSNASGYTAAPRLGYSLTAVADFVMPKRATLLQKTDLIAYLRNFLTNAQVTDLLYSGLAPF